MDYVIGEKYYAIWTHGWQCLATLVDIEKGDSANAMLYLMYNDRHGYFYNSKEELDAHN